MLEELRRHIADFQTWLQDAGFEPEPQERAWNGAISVEGTDPKTGLDYATDHKLTIILPPEFPYRAPVVISRDDPRLAPSLHLLPEPVHALCLWNSPNGWRPHYTAQWLLHRIAEWYHCYHTGIWPANSEVPDLDRYLVRVGLVVIGEEWSPPDDQNSGRFLFWKHRNHSETMPCMASCSSNTGLQLLPNEPEDRLTKSLPFVAENYERLSGIWFRVSRPFVPPDNLGGLLSSIEASSDAGEGWTKQAFISVFGHKLSGNGFPIAIGYTDNQNALRWQFLWAQLPPSGSKRQKVCWSSPSSLFQIKLKSFRTAPARKTDLLRRSAHLSSPLSSRKVIVFGLGALGGSIAVLLAKAGIEEIRLVDDDVLLPGNVIRHVCNLRYVGFPKTLALQQAIQAYQPDCHVQCYESTWEVETLRKHTEGCDVIIDATASYNFSLHLSEVCLGCDQPILFSTAYRRAAIGRVIAHRDRNDPCLACYADAARFWSRDDYPLIPPDPESRFIEDGCGEPTEEAAALDVEAVANLTARVAIQMIRRELGDRNLAILVNEPLADAGGMLAQQGIHWRANKPLPSCSICRG